MNKSTILITLIIGFIVFNSCQNNDIITDSDAKLEFSTDTVTFDTVFTTIGSSTRFFKVINPYTNDIEVSSIRLAKGDDSNFRININGNPTSENKDVLIPANDSLFIFVEVTVDPNRDEMLEHDSIIFETNGNEQDVDLVAFGQDVNLINDSVIACNQTWTNEKPYLIYNSMQVAENCNLTLTPGAHLYFHRNSTMQILGTLNANGTLEEPIIFEGDRLEHDYFDVPGQWNGIWFTKLSKNNTMNYTEVKNANTGIVIDSIQNNQPMLIIQNSIIQHHTIAGMYTRMSAVLATNCVFDDCGIWSAALTRGGAYWFYNCTFGNYWTNTVRNSPSVLIQNWYKHTDGTVYVYNQQEAYFGNCIIWGNKETEIGISGYTDGVEFNYKFDNCMLKIDKESDIDTSQHEHFKNNFVNIDPKFLDYSDYDFQLDTLSPAKDAGSLEIINQLPGFITFDINNINRTSDGKPDIGAYERIED